MSGTIEVQINLASFQAAEHQLLRLPTVLRDGILPKAISAAIKPVKDAYSKELKQRLNSELTGSVAKQSKKMKPHPDHLYQTVAIKRKTYGQTGGGVVVAIVGTTAHLGSRGTLANLFASPRPHKYWGHDVGKTSNPSALDALLAAVASTKGVQQFVFEQVVRVETEKKLAELAKGAPAF